jgi:hypothetical protein
VPNSRQSRVGAAVIPQVSHPGHSPALLSLVFAAGQRPTAEDVAVLSARERTFAISHRPPDEEGWLELLVNGLTFDLTGLARAGPAEAPPVAHCFGVSVAATKIGEAIALAPGPHLAAGRAMPPVIRGAASIGLCLARLDGVEFVCWHPARSAIGREPFARSVAVWLAGGAFPALGLTSLYCAPDGRMCSEGLALFTGQELCVERSGKPANEDAKLALRLIDRLVHHGRVTEPLTWMLDASDGVELEPESAGTIIRAWRRSR